MTNNPGVHDTSNEKKPTKSIGHLCKLLGYIFITLNNTGKEFHFDPDFLRQIVFEDNQIVDERKLLIMEKSQLINAKGPRN